MTENELKLIEMIRDNDNPEQALQIAVEIILDYLNRQKSSESKSSVVFREFV